MIKIENKRKFLQNFYLKKKTKNKKITKNLPKKKFKIKKKSQKNYVVNKLRKTEKIVSNSKSRKKMPKIALIK